MRRIHEEEDGPGKRIGSSRGEHEGDFVLPNSMLLAEGRCKYRSSRRNRAQSKRGARELSEAS